MREIQNVRQHPGEPHRRWFTSSTMELILWEDDRGHPLGFQILYSTPEQNMALTWRDAHGFTHHTVDNGEHRARRRKMSPILRATYPPDKCAVRSQFKQTAHTIDPTVFLYVCDRLSQATTQIS